MIPEMHHVLVPSHGPSSRCLAERVLGRKGVVLTVVCHDCSVSKLDSRPRL